MKESRLRKLSILSGVNPNDADYPKLQAYIEEYIELIEKRNEVIARTYGLYDAYGQGVDDTAALLMDKHQKTLERIFHDAGHPYLPAVLQKMMNLDKRFTSSGR